MATLKEITELILNWHTSGTNSKHDPEWRSFTTKFRNAFQKEMAKVGASKFQWNNGHYYVSGFFTMPSGQIYYFSLSDVRAVYPVGGYPCPLMYRTAEHYKDWKGGGNQWVNIADGMANEMRLR